MKLSQTVTCTLAAVALCAFLPRGAVAEQAFQPASIDPELKEELAYIEALVEADMPDIAAPIISAAKRKWPNAGPKLRVLELQGVLRRGEFDAVQKVVDSMKGEKGHEGEYWAIRLSMANEYYARSMMPQCRQIYEEFFKTVTNPGADLLDFYLDSGFKWAQICVREKKFDDAVQMYGKLLAQSLPEERWCMVALEDVELLLRLAEEIPADTRDRNARKRAEYLATAERLVDKLLWKSELILVFGKAIAMKAHIEMLRGHPDKAQALMNDYLPQLSEIHRNLVEQDPEGKLGFVRASPMPECRYLLAKMLWDSAQAEAKKPQPNEDLIKDCLFGARVGDRRNDLGAYNHAVNVCVKYPESAWAPHASDMKEDIAAFVKGRYGKEIKAKLRPDQIERLRKVKYQSAFELYRSGEFEKAAKAYQDLLGHVKDETEDSARARGVLAECYINLRQNAQNGSTEQADYAKMAAEAEDFVATQFKGKSAELVRAAGNATLRLAVKEYGVGARGRAQQLFDAYFANYSEHCNAVQPAYVLASMAFKGEDWATAIRFYELLVKQYPKSPYAVDSMQYLAACNEKVGNDAEQEKWLRQFANATKKKDESLSTFLKLAVMQQKRAFKDYELADKTTNAEEAATIRKAAFKTALGAVRDFQAVNKGAANVLESSYAKALDEKARAHYLLRREQALFLLGNCLQRVPEKDPKMLSRLRKNAVVSYEMYLAAYPKGQFAAQALMRIGTIHTAEKDMEKADEAFARLQRDFPESDEAKNSVPRLAKALIEMGMKSEGVAQYRKMLDTDGKYTAGQFLLAGNALLEAKSWDVAGDAYAKVIELATPLASSAYYLQRALMGQAKAAYGAKNYAEARQKLDEFVEKYSRSKLVIDAYDMLADVATIEGCRERDDALRMDAFKTAIRALKKLRNYKKDPIEQYELDIRSGEMLLRKMEAESAMDLTDAAKETRARAIVAFQAYLLAHEPENKEAFEKLSPKEKELLKRCYEDVLPPMAAQGADKAVILEYGNKYRTLFPKNLDVEAVLKPLEGN